MKFLFTKLFKQKRTPAETKTEAPKQPWPNTRYGTAVSRVSKSPLYRPYVDAKHPYGFYHNRHIICEHSRVIGGIYLSAEPAEALVVDECYDMLKPIVASFKCRMRNSFDTSVESELGLLEEIFHLADSAFRYSPKDVFDFNSREGIKIDGKVALDVYIKEKLGSSRHKVLLAAYLIEKLKEEGRLTGIVTIPGQIRLPDGDDETLVYTFFNGAFATYDPRPTPGKNDLPNIAMNG